MGKRSWAGSPEDSSQGLVLTRGVEVIDVVERVRGGWYEVTAVGADLRMDARLKHEVDIQISVNGYRVKGGLDAEDNPEVCEIFERYPSQFAAAVLVAREAPFLGQGRYSVGPSGITPLSNAFEDANPAGRRIRGSANEMAAVLARIRATA